VNALQRQVCRLQTLRIAERKGDTLRRDVDVAIRELVVVILSVRPVTEQAAPPVGECTRSGHPEECEADPKVGCVRWRLAP
jgi:hypothetical protein